MIDMNLIRTPFYIGVIIMSMTSDEMLVLWQSVEKLVRKLAHAYCKTSETRLFDFDDLMQQGYLAVVDTADSHDPARGKFNTLLAFNLRRRFNEAAGVCGNKQRPERFAVSLDEPITGDPDSATRGDEVADPNANGAFDDIESRIWNEQLHDALNACLATLPGGHADVLTRRYYKNETQQEIAAARGVSKSRVCTIEREALHLMNRGRNMLKLKEFRTNIISTAFHRNSYTEFTQTGSRVEHLAAQLIDGYDYEESERY